MLIQKNVLIFLKEIGVTAQEAKELEFFDFVCELLPETYD